MIPIGSIVPLVLSPLFLVLAGQHARYRRKRWAWTFVGMALFYPLVFLAYCVWQTLAAMSAAAEL